MADSSEEVPLNPNESKENHQTKLNYRYRANNSDNNNYNRNKTTDDIERSLLSPNVAGISNGIGNRSKNALKRGGHRVTYNLRDINAMSVASVYDTENNEIMDAENDIVNENSDRICIDIDTVSESSDLLLPLPMDIMGSPINDFIGREKHMPDCESCYSEPPEPFTASNVLGTSLYFEDGNRSIDFVLVWQPNEDEKDEDLNCVKRRVFERNLVNEGLEIEQEKYENLTFIKIHAPVEVLRRYAEILKLRMPMKEIPGFRGVQDKTTSAFSQIKLCGHNLMKTFAIDENHFPKRTTRFTAIYSRDKEYLFDVNHACFFTPAIRSRIVQFILDRKRYTLGNGDDYSFGIERLIDEEAYIAAYPLHDGEISIPGSVRHLLYTEWASLKNIHRAQPLDYIKEYFGVKIGLYFAWLGYYTYMLILASIVGILCFIYALATMKSYIPGNEICNGSFNVIMCPSCDKYCDYWFLSTSCVHVRITYLFDNPTTVFFAIFMSFWAALFLELWKRYSAEITHRWDLTGFDIHEEHPRPQYLARLAHVKKVKIDYVTNTKEPQPPFWRMKLPAAVFSFSIVFLLVTMAMAAVLGVVFYRMSMIAALALNDEYINTTAKLQWFTNITAASINLCLIFVFNWIYTWLAEYLTEFEILRTQTEFDDSLTLKIYLLQFVNYYASIFYIAFFKGKFIGYPGNYNRFFNIRQEECGVGGCLSELCIQLAIIMIGKQTMNAILEMVMPLFYKWYNKMKIRLGKRKSLGDIKRDGQRWLRDLKLIEWGPRSLFPEYLEMVLQYGFVTIFVAAFPLAPFFALLNNIFELRLDAKKILTHHRRPVTQRVRDIGVWYRILDCIGKLSVITNAFIIAFTSDFIPRLIYRTYGPGDGSLSGYLNYSLSTFNTKNFTNKSTPINSIHQVQFCRYSDYRDSEDYKRTELYWVILASRFAFVVIFENFVAVVMIIVRWAIPDMSSSLRDRIRREAYITNEIVIKQEAALTKIRSRPSSMRGSSLTEPIAEIENIDQLMSDNLSRSQLDLAIHGPDDPIMPGHCKPRDNLTKLNYAFLETEKNGGQHKIGNETTIVVDDDEMETSQL